VAVAETKNVVSTLPPPYDEMGAVLRSEYVYTGAPGQDPQEMEMLARTYGWTFRSEVPIDRNMESGEVLLRHDQWAISFAVLYFSFFLLVASIFNFRTPRDIEMAESQNKPERKNTPCM